MSNGSSWTTKGAAPDGPGTATGWGQAPSAAEQAAPRATRFITYAGFWRRLGGAILTGLLVGLVALPAQLAYGFLSRQVLDLTASCDSYSTNLSNNRVYQGCEPSTGLAILLFMGYLALSFAIWWVMVPGRIGKRGATLGMQAVDTRIIGARDHLSITAGTAFIRELARALSVLIAYIPLAVVLTAHISLTTDIELFRTPLADYEQLEWTTGWATLYVFCYLAISLPSLWMLIDRRRQTLYDKLSGCLVIVGD